MKMRCEHIQAHLRAGGEPGLDLEAHLDECLECAEVAAEVEGLGTDDGVTLPDLDRILGAVEGVIAQDRGPRAWLRDRSTRARMLLGAAIGFGLPLGYGIATLRADISVYPVARFAVITFVLAALLAVALWAGMRPLHRPALSPGVVHALSFAAVGAVLITASIPAAHALHPASLAGISDDLVRRAAACFAVGLAIGVPVALGVRALNRARASWLGAPIMAPLAGVVAGNLALHLHCPLVAPQHLLAGHAAVLVPFVVAFGLLALRWRRVT